MPEAAGGDSAREPNHEVATLRHITPHNSSSQRRQDKMLNMFNKQEKAMDILKVSRSVLPHTVQY